jgi:hypothetical protein
MKRIFNLKQHLNSERALSYALVFVLSFFGSQVNTVHNAMGQASPAEPYISLNVKNKPLGEVFKIISADTGYTFKLNDQWRNYPVYASLENLPLHQVLKRILGRLNHTIIYESDKSIHIVIYGVADSRKSNQSPVQSFPSQIQQYPQEPEPAPEPSFENANDPERVTESSIETGAPGITEEKSAEETGPVESAEKEKTGETGPVESKEPDKAASSPGENPIEQNEQNKVDADASPDGTEKQN